MLVVEIFKNESFAGTITWDGDRMRVKGDLKLLNFILKEPVWMPMKDGLKDVFAKDSPEEFMRGLQLHYKSYALRASGAREIANA